MIRVARARIASYAAAGVSRLWVVIMVGVLSLYLAEILPSEPIGPGARMCRFATRAAPVCSRFRHPPSATRHSHELSITRVMRAWDNRKNWLFVGSDTGGRTAAVIFTVTASRERHGVDPFAYLRDVLRLLADLRPGGLDGLLLDQWKLACLPVLPAPTVCVRCGRTRFPP